MYLTGVTRINFCHNFHARVKGNWSPNAGKKKPVPISNKALKISNLFSVIYQQLYYLNKGKDRIIYVLKQEKRRGD